jgi:hypothetical protein
MRGRSLVVGHLPAHINDSGPPRKICRAASSDLTFTQLDQEITRKRTAVTANRDLISLERLRSYLAPHMAKKPDEPIGPVLASLAGKEEKSGGAKG